MQPHELCWRQRPRNLLDLPLANCSETAQNVSEKYVLQRVAGKFKAHVEAKTSVAKGNFR